jgi:hypothetical protein
MFIESTRERFALLRRELEWTFDLQIALAPVARGTRALPGRASFDESPGRAVSISQVVQSERSDSLGAHASRVLFGRTEGATWPSYGGRLLFLLASINIGLLTEAASPIYI